MTANRQKPKKDAKAGGGNKEAEEKARKEAARQAQSKKKGEEATRNERLSTESTQKKNVDSIQTNQQEAQQQNQQQQQQKQQQEQTQQQKPEQKAEQKPEQQEKTDTTLGGKNLFGAMSGQAPQEGAAASALSGDGKRVRSVDENQGNANKAAGSLAGGGGGDGSAQADLVKNKMQRRVSGPDHAIEGAGDVAKGKLDGETASKPLEIARTQTGDPLIGKSVDPYLKNAQDTMKKSGGAEQNPMQGMQGQGKEQGKEKDNKPASNQPMETKSQGGEKPNAQGAAPGKEAEKGKDMKGDALQAQGKENKGGAQLAQGKENKGGAQLAQGKENKGGALQQAQGKENKGGGPNKNQALQASTASGGAEKKQLQSQQQGKQADKDKSAGSAMACKPKNAQIK